MVILTVTNLTAHPVLITPDITLSAASRAGSSVTTHLTGAALEALSSKLTYLKNKNAISYSVEGDPADILPAAASTGSSEFLWTPDATGTLASNQFTDWPSLYAAASAAPRGRRIVTCSANAECRIPAGNWNLQYWDFRSAAGDQTYLVFSDGAHIVPIVPAGDYFSLNFDALTIYWENTDSPVLDFNGVGTIGVNGMFTAHYCLLNAGNWGGYGKPTKAFLKHSDTSSHLPALSFAKCYVLGTGNVGFLETVAGSTTNVEFIGSCNVGSQSTGDAWVQGAGTVNVTLSSDTWAWLASPAFTGTLTTILAGNASSINFDKKTSTMTSTDVNTAFLELSGRTLALGAKQAANFNAAVGYRYPVDLTTTAITSKMPGGTHTAGDKIGFGDAMGAAATHNLTVDFVTNSQKLNGASANYTMNTNGGRVVFVYVDATVGWMQE